MQKMNESHQFYEHFLALRSCIYRCLLSVAIIFAVLFYFSQPLFHYFVLPLLQQYTNGKALIAIDVVSPFLTPLKFTLVLAILVAIPLLLYNIWSFIAPGLYRQERQPIWVLLLSSTLLFYIGVAFVYFVVLPLLFNFFAKLVPDYVLFMPDIQHYLGFSLKLFLAFGCAFQVPVILYVIWKTGFVTKQQLENSRAYVIVIAFILGMLLTPPDVLSQVLLALPIWGLFELGLLFIRFRT